MSTNIIKRLLYSFMVSIILSITILIVIQNYTDSDEAKSVNTALWMVAILLCGINFILSFTALFNLRKDIRENIYNSAFTFMGLPIFTFLLIILYIYKKQGGGSKNIQSCILILGPSIVYLFALIYHFAKFQKGLKHKSIKFKNL